MSKNIINFVELAFIAVGAFAYQFVKNKKEEEQIERRTEQLKQRTDYISELMLDAQKSCEEAIRNLGIRTQYKVIWYGGTSYLYERDSKVFNNHEAAEDYRKYLKEKHPDDLITIETVYEAD